MEIWVAIGICRKITELEFIFLHNSSLVKLSNVFKVVFKTAI